MGPLSTHPVQENRQHRDLYTWQIREAHGELLVTGT